MPYLWLKTVGGRCWKNPSRRGYDLDVAQLVKHYLGLIRLVVQGDQVGWRPREATLLYLFWEPLNGHEVQLCQEHRRDLEELASSVASSKINFRCLSYPELWQS
jgi:hypothetical protein